MRDFLGSLTLLAQAKVVSFWGDQRGDNAVTSVLVLGVVSIPIAYFLIKYADSTFEEIIKWSKPLFDETDQLID